MPKKLEDCVKKVMRKGHTKEEAFAICADSTGWVKHKGGGWVNKKTGKIVEEKNKVITESFLF